jgi:hypothetical protein
MTVVIELETTAAVVSTEAWSRKGMLEMEPVVVSVVVDAEVPAGLVLKAVVPACATNVLSTVSRAVVEITSAEPAGSVTSSTRAPTGGGGGGEQHRAATSTAPGTLPVQA